jgi:transcriptional regulator with GAF, ATPase, and Fis domain
MPKEQAFNHFMEQMSRLLSHDQDIEDVLDFVFHGLSKLIPFERMGIGLFTPGKKLRLYWVRSNIRTEHLAMDYTVDLDNSSLGEFIETGRPRIIPDLIEYAKKYPDSDPARLALKDGIHSVLTFPLITDGQPIGAVFFSSRTPNQFTLEHAELFSCIAGEVAEIMEQARLKNYFSSTR